MNEYGGIGPMLNKEGATTLAFVIHYVFQLHYGCINKIIMGFLSKIKKGLIGCVVSLIKFSNII